MEVWIQDNCWSKSHLLPTIPPSCVLDQLLPTSFLMSPFPLQTSALAELCQRILPSALSCGAVWGRWRTDMHQMFPRCGIEVSHSHCPKSTLGLHSEIIFAMNIPSVPCEADTVFTMGGQLSLTPIASYLLGNSCNWGVIFNEEWAQGKG